MKAYNNFSATTYRIDLKTTNTSFLKMALILKSKGVENCYFMLRIDNKNLVGVNPYSKKLTREQKAAIFSECINNRWYFYREVARVSESGAATGIGGGSEFILNRGNLAYLWCAEKNIDCYLIMPRQTGKTWAAIIDAVWTYQFTRGSTILHFNKSQKDSNDNLQRIKSAISMLPLYLQHSADENLDPSEKKLVKNAEKSMRNIIGSQIEAMASAGNDSKADAMARGKTAPKIWYDEIAFIFFNEVIYAAATPAYEKAMENAIKNHAPYGISITTTPGDLATPHGNFAWKMMDDSIRFNESFYDMPSKELFDIVNNTPGKVPYFFIQYSYTQLGETEEWYLKRYKKMNDPLRARREYLLEWMNSNGNSPFDPDDVEQIKLYADEAEKHVNVVRINKYYELRVYDEYRGRKPVMIGVDVAGSMGRDSSAIVVANPETLKPLAVFRSNMIDLASLQKLIVTVVKRMYPNCILTIENNSVGEGVIRNLLETSIGNRIYKERATKVQDMGPNSITKKRKVQRVVYGHNTNTHTRPQMMEILETTVHNSPVHLGIPELYDEISYLELRNGRIDHMSDHHDDVVMAYMGLLWVVKYGRGMKGKGIYYNIDDGSDGYEDASYDLTDAMRNADRVLSKAREGERDEEQEFIDYMSRNHHTQDSNDWMDREREEYFKAIDRIDGISDEMDDDPISISESTQRLLLSNYEAMLQIGSFDDGYGDNPIDQLLQPVRFGGDDEESFIDHYRWLIQ